MSMKTMTCRDMGGMCDEPVTAATKEEMMAKGMEHVGSAHPEMAATINAMPKDDPKMVEWQQKFDQKWDATAETPAE